MVWIAGSGALDEELMEIKGPDAWIHDAHGLRFNI